MSPNASDTICAIATATGRGGIGIVRISGPKTRQISAEILGFEPTPRQAHSTNFLNASGATIDSGIAIFFAAPNSFTGEDILELQGHGGAQILHEVMEQVLSFGVREANPGEFSERAFLNNKIDLVQAEANTLKFDNILPRVILRYKASEDSMFYGSYSKGVLPGKANDAIASATDYEYAQYISQFPNAKRFLEEEEIPGWDIIDGEIKDATFQDPNMPFFTSAISLEIDIERKHGYYIFKVIFPIILILLICWSVFWIHPRELESKLTITIVCLLSLIAYNFVIEEDVPKLSYLTIMDHLILASYIFATIPNFLSIRSTSTLILGNIFKRLLFKISTDAPNFLYCKSMSSCFSSNKRSKEEESSILA